MRTVEEIQSDITRVQQNQRKANAFISQFTTALSKANELEQELDTIIPLVETIRNNLNSTNTEIKAQSIQLVGESVFVKSLMKVIEGKFHSIADTRYNNIDYYYGQLKQLRGQIDTSEIQEQINKYSGYISQYQTELAGYQQELAEAQAVGN